MLFFQCILLLFFQCILLLFFQCRGIHWVSFQRSVCIHFCQWRCHICTTKNQKGNLYLQWVRFIWGQYRYLLTDVYVLDEQPQQYGFEKYETVGNSYERQSTLESWRHYLWKKHQSVWLLPGHICWYHLQDYAKANQIRSDEDDIISTLGQNHTFLKYRLAVYS